jgi:maltose/moltooligosaccharide transporter
LNGNPENVIRLAGALLILAAIAVLFVKVKKVKEGTVVPVGAGH